MVKWHPLVIHNKDPHPAVYCGRQRDRIGWGNPWSHVPNSCAEFIVNSVEEAIDKYESYFVERWNTDLQFRNEVRGLRGKYLKCWCRGNYPGCHCNIIASYANEEPAMKIESFEGRNRFLSNFWPCTVYVSHGDDDVREYKSVEHAFQALKTLDMLEREAIRSARSPSEAKAMGRTVKLRPDWDDKKIGFMRMLVRQKFSTNPLRSELMATGEAELIDGNYWHDTFWGMCGGVGTNHLGKILMEVRQEIADEQKATPVSQVTGKLTMDDV